MTCIPFNMNPLSYDGEIRGECFHNPREALLSYSVAELVWDASYAKLERDATKRCLHGEKATQAKGGRAHWSVPAVRKVHTFTKLASENMMWTMRTSPSGKASVLTRNAGPARFKSLRLTTSPTFTRQWGRRVNTSLGRCFASSLGGGWPSRSRADTSARAVNCETCAMTDDRFHQSRRARAMACGARDLPCGAAPRDAGRNR